MKIYDYCLNSREEQTISELATYQCGHENCTPGHIYGYAIRDHYLLHYIVSGSGEYHVGGNVYKLSKGDGFLICPSISTMYKASVDDPWEYYWVGFYGSEARNLLRKANLGGKNLIFHNDDQNITDYLKQMYSAQKSSIAPETQALGFLYLLISKLIAQYELDSKTNPDSPDYVEKALNFIKCNYSKKISVQKIADLVGIDRSQLFRLFKLQINISPQEYINKFRVAQACELLKTSDSTVEQIAHTVGIGCNSYFFKIFKKETNLTPVQYKKHITKANSD